MSDILSNLTPYIAPVLVPFVSALITMFQQHKAQGNSVLSEQYKNFIAPIFRLLNRDYSVTYLITEIDRIFDEYPYLIPDKFDEEFNKFKQSYNEETTIKNSNFYKCVENLYIYLRHELHYSKENVKGKGKEEIKEYFGKHPTLCGVFWRAFVMSFISLIIAMYFTYIYGKGYMVYSLYVALLCILSFVILVITIIWINKYYDVKL